MGARAITDLETVKSAAPSTQGVDDAVLERSLDAASLLIEKLCNRRFYTATYAARHSGSKAYGDDSERLVLTDPDTGLLTPVVTAISSAKEDGTTLSTTVSGVTTISNGEYAMYGALNPILYRMSVSGNILSPVNWATGEGNVLLAYTAGYSSATMPADIIQACVELTWLIYREGSRSGLNARNATSGSASFLRELSPTAQAAINNHTIEGVKRTLAL